MKRAVPRFVIDVRFGFILVSYSRSRFCLHASCCIAVAEAGLASEKDMKRKCISYFPISLEQNNIIFHRIETVHFGPHIPPSRAKTQCSEGKSFFFLFSFIFFDCALIAKRSSFCGQGPSIVFTLLYLQCCSDV